MLAISGFTFGHSIVDNRRVAVFRATDESDGTPVVIKTLRDEYPSPQDLARLRKEFEIAHELDHEGVANYLARVPHGNSLALIMEDFGGRSLSSMIEAGPLAVETFLDYAIKIADALAYIHRKGVIHRDLKPSNLLVNPETGRVCIIDFSVSSLLTSERQKLVGVRKLEGSLQYVSPEQTGRMNRPIDWRTDFYSLGVAFFELLTGRLPFTSTVPMELVHCHLAQVPPPVHELNPEVPQVLSEIVARMMAKTAEQRYQNALGLKSDLERVRAAHLAGAGIEGFELGESDLLSTFQIPNKLYGRDQEIEALLTIFDDVCESGTQMALVTGYSGVGKSALIEEIHKPIVRRHGHFIASKFDQYRRDIPYASIHQAFSSLVRQLLTEPEERINEWQQRVLEVLDNMGQVIIDVIPEVQLLIGEQPPVIALEGPEAQNRFLSVFERFLSVFARKECPLVFFLDDLQWADLATLRLLEALMDRKESHHLLVLGAYRDNEVNASHPLMLTLDKIRKRRALHHIQLESLNLDHTKELIADSLHSSGAAVQPLAELIHAKTHGNPFFLRQLLQSLVEQGTIEYSFEERRWAWDVDDIRFAAVSDQVVDLMTAKILKLDEQAQELLELAACLGNQFDHRTLGMVSGLGSMGVIVKLFTAIKEGLLLALDSSFQYFVRSDTDASQTIDLDENFVFRFLHDRVHEAAYARLDEDSRKRTHLRIGQILRERRDAADIDEWIFDVVNHLNIGVELLDEPAARVELAKLNLIAGKKARSNTAHFAARDYLARGLELLTDAAWAKHYQTTFELHRNLIECEYLCKNMDRATELFDIALDHAQSRGDKADIFELLMTAYMKYGRFKEGVDLGRRALAMYDIELPEDPATFQEFQAKEYAAIERLIAGRSNAELAQIEANPDQDLSTAMSLLHQTWDNAYFAEGLYDLGTVAALRIATISLEQGYTSYTPFGYVTYGLNLSSVFGEYEKGDRFGRLAMDLQHKFNNIHLVGKINNLFGHFISHYRRSFDHSIQCYEESYHACLQTGDLWYGLWAVNFIPHVKFIKGEALDEVYAEVLKYHDYAENSGNEMMFQLLNMDRHMILNLQGKTEDPLSFDSPDYGEAAMVEMLEAIPFDFGLFWYDLYKSFVFYLYGELDRALEHSLAAEKNKTTAPGLMLFVEQHFHHALILAANFERFSEAEQRGHRETLDHNLAKLKNWGHNCPVNYEHKYLLVAGEIARLEGDKWRALELLERGAVAANEVGALHNAAIGYELICKLFGDHVGPARAYLREARYRYERWGATRKLAALDEHYADWLAAPTRAARSRSGVIDITTTDTNTGPLNELLDLNTILRLSQMLSREIVFSELLRKMLGVLIENAGAERGALLVERHGQWMIVANGAAGHIEVLDGLAYNKSKDVSAAVIQYVLKTRESLVLEDALESPSFASDERIASARVRSLLCLPITHHNRLSAVLYLENNLATGSFTTDRLNVLEMLTAQAAISIENAVLYANLEEYSQSLEHKVAERTQELREKNSQLESKNQQIVRTQQKLVTQEKMASLGTLTAGVAHEINNPTNFVNGSTRNLVRDLQDFQTFLFELAGEDADPEIADALRKRMSPLFSHTEVILNGTDRIRSIVRDLQSFSRMNEAELKSAELTSGITSTISLVRPSYHGFVEFETEFEDSISLECRPAELNQVFMNIIVNGCQAIAKRREHEPEVAGTIKVRTWREQADAFIEFSDNGAGMSPSVREKIFEPFFSTKGTGEGTGLGLAISYGIVQRHGGEIRVDSVPGEGSTFTLVLPAGGQ